MKKVRGGRGLLNLPGHESTSAIVAEVAQGQYGLDITYQISDCSRVINLSFSVDTWENFENAMHKCDTIIDATKKFQNALRAEWRKA